MAHYANYVMVTESQPLLAICRSYLNGLSDDQERALEGRSRLEIACIALSHGDRIRRFQLCEVMAAGRSRWVPLAAFPSGRYKATASCTLMAQSFLPGKLPCIHT